MKQSALVLVAVALAGCAPMAWVKITKRPAAPPPGTGVPGVTSPALPLPGRFENRLDRFALGTKELRDAAAAFDDYGLGPATDDRRLRRAYAAWHRLQDALGDPSIRGRNDWADAVTGVGVIVAEETQEDDELTLYDVELAPAIRSFAGVGLVRITDAAGRPHHGVVIDDQASDPTQPIVVAFIGAPFEVGQAVNVDGARLADPIHAFIHISDVQLRDSDIKLVDPAFSARFDPLVESFEHDEDQEAFGRYVFEAVIATIRAGHRELSEATADPRRLAPSLAIHTGDATDVGTIAEMDTFHELMDSLPIPWFDVVGNHDALIFGNLLPSDEEGRYCSSVGVLLDATGAPAWVHGLVGRGRLCALPEIPGTTERFIADTPGELGTRAFIEHHLHAPLDLLPPNRNRPCPGVKGAAASRQHGFDLEVRGGVKPGFYRFGVLIDVAGVTRCLHYIVLNTEVLDGGSGALGRVGDDQLRWLEREILPTVKPADLAMVFAHHPISEIEEDARLEGILAAAPNVVGYFYGHRHVHGICRDKRPGVCKHFWEVETGSILEVPQEARLVTLKHLGRGVVFFELIAFGERLRRDAGDGFIPLVERAQRGANRDHCRKHRCNPDGLPRRDDGADTFARLFFCLPGAACKRPAP